MNIRSSIVLPELISGGGGEDVVISEGNFALPPERTCIAPCIHATSEQVFLNWEDVGTFQLIKGRELVYTSAPGVEEQVLRLFILGSGIGVLLHQQNKLVLHASAVAVNGGAVAFIGDKGWGKSTTAAAMMSKGYPLITDDLLVIENVPESDAAWVLPGYPQVKLWPDVFESLGYEAENFPRSRPELEKRSHSFEIAFIDHPVPLKSIYLLGAGEELAAVPLPGQVALMQLIRHLYVSRFGTFFLNTVGGAAFFEKCADLSRIVPMRLLRRPFDLSQLSSLVNLIEDDLS